MHCKNTSVTCTPNLLYTHTKWRKGVCIEQIWCAGHTCVFTVWRWLQPRPVSWQCSRATTECGQGIWTSYSRTATEEREVCVSGILCGVPWACDRCSGVTSNSGEVRAIEEAPPPGNISELKAYLGLLTYYSKFLPKFLPKRPAESSAGRGSWHHTSTRLLGDHQHNMPTPML